MCQYGPHHVWSHVRSNVFNKPQQGVRRVGTAHVRPGGKVELLQHVHFVPLSFGRHYSHSYTDVHNKYVRTSQSPRSTSVTSSVVGCRISQNTVVAKCCNQTASVVCSPQHNSHCKFWRRKQKACGWGLVEPKAKRHASYVKYLQWTSTGVPGRALPSCLTLWINRNKSSVDSIRPMSGQEVSW